MGIPGRTLITAFCFALILFAGGTVKSTASAQDLKRLKLPDGYAISLFAQVPGARSIAIHQPSGLIFVGSRSSVLHVVQDKDKDGKADVVRVISDKLKVPNGIAIKANTLYVAEQHRIVKFDIPRDATAESDFGEPVVVKTGLPDKGHHGWRYATIGPDGLLYMAIGTPCNICDPDGIEGTIVRLDPAQSGKQALDVYARGIRNSVGMDFHPKTGTLFFTDNGADGMGDDIPPDELNKVSAKGQHFGYPYLGGKDVELPGIRQTRRPMDVEPPVMEFQAHTACLGIHFYRGTMFPASHRNDAFMAQHGSWNRSSKVGYRVMRLKFDARGNALGKEPFITGWLENESHWGRPVDVKEMDDGSLLISDDYAGILYRVTYDGR